MLNPKNHVVQRKGSDSFYADFYTSPNDGGRPQRVFRSLKTKNKAEAIHECARLIEKYGLLSAAAIRVENNLTVSDLFLKYIDTKRASSPSTVTFYECGRRSAVKYFGEAFLVNDLDLIKMTKYHTWLSDSGKAPDTVRHWLSSIKVVCKWAWESQLIRTNPIKQFKLPRGSGDRLNWFSGDQLEEILGLMTEPNFGLVLALAHLGGRKTSVLKMEWDWIDFDKKIVEFPSQVIKTRIAVRVPLSDRLYDYLVEKKETMDADAKYVFSRDGGKTRLNDLRFQYNRALKTLGLKGNVHSLRHTFATNYLEQNPGDMKGLASLLGWRDIKMVMKYAHITQRQFEGQRAVINEMYRTKRQAAEGSENVPSNITKLVTKVVTDDLSPKVMSRE